MKHGKKQNIRKKPCLFCNWAEDLREAQKFLGKNAGEITVKDMAKFRFQTDRDKNRPWKSQFIKANEYFFAVLSQESKIVGHTLIISRDHFSDITDPKLISQGNQFRIAFFDIMTEMAGKLTRLTNDPIPKVYAMSVCEHWSKKELEAAGKSYDTEHLHFHLLPRINAMRTPYPYYLPESMFVRCDVSQAKDDLARTRERIMGACSTKT